MIEVRESATYNVADSYSYFADLGRSVMGIADEDAEERLRRHAIDVETNAEIRRLGQLRGDLPRHLKHVPPLWMLQRFQEWMPEQRPYVSLASRENLPPATDAINIPKIIKHEPVREIDLSGDTFIQAPVCVHASQQGVAKELLGDSWLISLDELLFRDLMVDYATKSSLQIILGTGSQNQHLGVRNTPGVHRISVGGFRRDSLNAQILYEEIGDAIRYVGDVRLQPPTAIVMHPRRWAWLLDVLVNELHWPVSDMELYDLPVVTDLNIPTNLGDGADEDVIHVLRGEDLLFFESGIRSRVLAHDGDGELLRAPIFQFYAYSAFTAGRFPAGIVEIGGPALNRKPRRLTAKTITARMGVIPSQYPWGSDPNRDARAPLMSLKQSPRLHQSVDTFS